MIEIPKYIIDAIVKQAKDELPNEACGLLTGEGNVVKKTLSAYQHRPKPRTFLFRPERAVRRIERCA